MRSEDRGARARTNTRLYLAHEHAGDPNRNRARSAESRGVGALLVLLLRGEQAGLGEGAALLRAADARLLRRSGREQRGAAEHRRRGPERRAVVRGGAQLVLLLQGHRAPQGHVAVHERALAARERAAQHQRVARGLRERGGLQRERARARLGREAERVRDPEGGTHRPLGGGGVVRAQRVLEQVSVGGQHQRVRVRVCVRVRAPVGAPAGQQHLDGPHHVPPAAAQDELQHRRLVRGKDLLQDLQGGPVGAQAEGQADGAPQALDQHARLRAGGRLLRAVGLGLLLSGPGGAVLRDRGGVWGLRGVAGVRFGALGGAGRVLLLLTARAAPGVPPGQLLRDVLRRVCGGGDESQEPGPEPRTGRVTNQNSGPEPQSAPKPINLQRYFNFLYKLIFEKN